MKCSFAAALLVFIRSCGVLLFSCACVLVIIASLDWDRIESTDTSLFFAGILLAIGIGFWIMSRRFKRQYWALIDRIRRLKIFQLPATRRRRMTWFCSIAFCLSGAALAIVLFLGWRHVIRCASRPPAASQLQLGNFRVTLDGPLATFDVVVWPDRRRALVTAEKSCDREDLIKFLVVEDPVTAWKEGDVTGPEDPILQIVVQTETANPMNPIPGHASRYSLAYWPQQCVEDFAFEVIVNDLLMNFVHRQRTTCAPPPPERAEELLKILEHVKIEKIPAPAEKQR